jgi:hypothetical protein
MKTLIDINSPVSGTTASVVVSQDTPAIPAVGDDVAIPTPYAAPMPGSYQQLTISNRIFRYQVDATGTPYLYLLLVTQNPIT